ncbi:MAG: tRNA pseudouridine(55) synthase TruB [Armatimonadota bacterium]|nr:tRNA pseudouridine(55) synthase TruB [Armatimonadota bacterium]MDR5703814.1 tRNA pseudouridine(55) synthase TruB [Armatimonadota bacterium]MDR7434292.1 tRNA pseudouridine(55) synthase TruB [Armatimonadota bacterium]
MDGILLVVKPIGMTSFDVVSYIRRKLRLRKVGHTGTLDPGASGILVLCLEKATRIAEFLLEKDKEYRFEMTLGKATTTGDAYGDVTFQAERVNISESQLREVLGRFVGEIVQIPPMASAVHVQGKRLYELARKGVEATPPPRKVTIYRLELLKFYPEDPPRALLHIACSKGTYVRRLCLDIGEALGCGAYASFMLRTRIGRFTLDQALTLEEVDDLAARGEIQDHLLSMDEALLDLPAIQVSAAQRSLLIHGQPIPLWKVRWGGVDQERGIIRLRDERGLLALAMVKQGYLRPIKVLRGP